MPRRCQQIACLLALAALLAAASAGPAPAAPRKAPFGFLGVNADGVYFDSTRSARDGQARLMARSGAESLRVLFSWQAAQPYATAGDVPAGEAARFVPGPGGVPTDFAAMDEAVGTAAARGMELLPVVQYSPRWASSDPAATDWPRHEPAEPATYTRFLEGLIARYGPGGGFWAANPGLPRRPVRAWQIWNEPSLAFFPDFRARYPRLLRRAHDAVKRADPGARVVLAGMVNFSWRDLAAMYRHGLKGAFDVAALHPYSGSVARLLKIIRLNRAVMRRNGDARKPVYLTEFTWAASKGKVPRRNHRGIEATPAEQRKRMSAALAKLSRSRSLRVRRAYWYTWATSYDSQFSFDYTGLTRRDGGAFQPLPLLAAYARAARRLEGCRKSDVATACR